MYQLKQLAGYLLLGIGLTSAPSHASIIQSMTIEEIGVASGGLGTSSATNLGGEFSLGGIPLVGFVSASSNDGTILMGQTQDIGEFTASIFFAGLLFSPNTLTSAPGGAISGSDITLDLSGWSTRVAVPGPFFIDELPSFPQDNLVASFLPIDANHFYYTADWSHIIAEDESPPFANVPVNYHLEGIATVPEPSTSWLLGASALGLMVSRRRKHA